MVRDTLREAVATARQSDAFRNYGRVRDWVLDMLDQAQAHGALPSDYWLEELAGFDYMLDAPPLIVSKLREHCYHLTGVRSYEYRSHHAHQTGPFAKKLQALRRQDTDNLLVPESSALGGFGHVVDGALVNQDTLKFYESLIALNKAGLLPALRSNAGERKIVLEIGAGWGGFAYQLKTLCPNVCYVIVDLPQTLLFSAVYLMTLFPKASVRFYGDRSPEKLLDEARSCDFAFLPHFGLGSVPIPKIDLAINMVSFQEMTSAHVEQYVRRLSDLGCPSLYSHNRDRSPHNSQLSTVSSILGRYYELVEQKVLDVPYTALAAPGAARGKRTSPMQAVRAMARRLLSRGEAPVERSAYEYRHLMGALKPGGAAEQGGRRP
jgi:putative sugar O-methyltransferase